MILKIRIEVHAYAEEKLADAVLVKHSKHYGIVGKDIVAPLRIINGKIVEMNVPVSYSVGELWDFIDKILYEGKVTQEGDDLLAFIKEWTPIEKYFVFHNLRYCVEDYSKPVKYYLELQGKDDSDIVDIQLLLNMDAGEIFEDDGIRYFIWSKEQGSHNQPHVHVDVRHEKEASYSIIDGSHLAGDKIKGSDEKRIRKKIDENKKQLLIYWNEHTDGLTVDLNQALGLIRY